MSDIKIDPKLLATLPYELQLEISENVSARILPRAKLARFSGAAKSR